MPKGQIKQKQITINKDFFELLCKAQCSQQEIVCALEVNEGTLRSWVRETYKNLFPDIAVEDLTLKVVQDYFSFIGKAGVKVNFFNKTQESESLMKLFLINYCGVKDKVEADITHDTVKIVSDLQDD